MTSPVGLLTQNEAATFLAMAQGNGKLATGGEEACRSMFRAIEKVEVGPMEGMPSCVLLVVNETEAAFYGERLQRARGLVAKTLGARGAELWRGGEKIAPATPPPVQPVDTTGAGDAFVAALVVDLLRQEPPDTALRFACAAGATATQARGAQPSLPTRTVIYSIAGI